MDIEKRVKTSLALKIGGAQMIEATKKFGATEITRLLIKESTKNDWVADELLYMFTTVIETHRFLNRCEWVWTPTEKEFEIFCKNKHICWG